MTHSGRACSSGWHGPSLEQLMYSIQPKGMLEIRLCSGQSAEFISETRDAILRAATRDGLGIRG